MVSMPAFDVFLCHNSADKPAVKAIGERLRAAGLKPWLAEWELQPGRPWQKQLEAQIKDIAAAAVFVGKGGEEPWQDLQTQAFLQQFVDRQSSAVIPVILPDYPQDEEPRLPLFLSLFQWVDFRKNEPDPLEQLIWGVTGKKPVPGQLPQPTRTTSLPSTPTESHPPEPHPPEPASPLPRRRWSWRQRISASLAAGLVGILATLVTWWWPHSPGVPPPAPISIYAIRVVVLSPEGRPVEGSTVHASVGSEPQRVTGGWEVEVPKAKLPRSRKVEIRAEDPASSASGQTEIVLDDDPTPSVEVQLVVVLARVRGLVVDGEGRALGG
jgi:hypothetical protein